MRIPREILQGYVDKGLLFCRKHPNKELWIYNYTPECAFSRAWDDITLLCRGLVLNAEGTVVALPFNKFFNFGEVESHKEYIGQTPSYILDKVDGSLGILFFWEGEWDICTRGSFESDQAIMARGWLNKFDLDILPKHYTYMCEIVYPENRIVVEYDESALWILGAYETGEGEEMPIKELFNKAFMAGFNVPGAYSFSNIKELMDWMSAQPKENAEGYVVTYSDGTKIKVKYEHYCVLHKIVTGLNERKVWESLSQGLEAELMSMIPDEFYKWTEDTIYDLKQQFAKINFIATQDYKEILKTDPATRKEFAELAKTKKYPGLLFLWLDNNYDKYEEAIWKIIKPKGDE